MQESDIKKIHIKMNKRRLRRNLTASLSYAVLHQKHFLHQDTLSQLIVNLLPSRKHNFVSDLNAVFVIC